jgi:hypothetical protein
MHGSVWGTSIHAFYKPEDKDVSIFQHNTTWISNFLLSTSGRRKIQNRVDIVLWAQAQRRILRLLIKEIGGAQDAKTFDVAINNINAKIQGEQLLCPYALPIFDWSIKSENFFGNTKDDTWFVSHRIDDGLSNEKSFLCLSWEIYENPFFTSRQSWSKKGTRNFLDAVDLGLKRGMELMSARIQVRKGVSDAKR